MEGKKNFSPSKIAVEICDLADICAVLSKQLTERPRLPDSTMSEILRSMEKQLRELFRTVADQCSVPTQQDTDPGKAERKEK